LISFTFHFQDAQLPYQKQFFSYIYFDANENRLNIKGINELHIKIEAKKLGIDVQLQKTYVCNTFARAFDLQCSSSFTLVTNPSRMVT